MRVKTLIVICIFFADTVTVYQCGIVFYFTSVEKSLIITEKSSNEYD